jgi:hypothetical protein
MSKNLDKLAKVALEEAEVRKRTQNIEEIQGKLKEVNEKISTILSNKISDPEIYKNLLSEKELLMKQIAQHLVQSKEIGGPQGPEPTRYGDWEKKGIVSDF